MPSSGTASSVATRNQLAGLAVRAASGSKNTTSPLNSGTSADDAADDDRADSVEEAAPLGGGRTAGLRGGVADVGLAIGRGSDAGGCASSFRCGPTVRW